MCAYTAKLARPEHARCALPQLPTVAQVAETKRSVFRALTRLRGAAISSFDGIARAQTGNIDESARRAGVVAVFKVKLFSMTKRVCFSQNAKCFLNERDICVFLRGKNVLAKKTVVSVISQTSFKNIFTKRILNYIVAKTLS